MEKNLVERKKSRWSFAKGRPIWMIICKRPAHPEIICKRPAHPDDHLQKPGPSGWSFAQGRLIRMIICKRPANLNDQLQKAGWSGWSHDSHCNILMPSFSRKCEKFSPRNPFWPKITNTSFNFNDICRNQVLGQMSTNFKLTIMGSWNIFRRPRKGWEKLPMCLTQQKRQI